MNSETIKKIYNQLSQFNTAILTNKVAEYFKESRLLSFSTLSESGAKVYLYGVEYKGRTETFSIYITETEINCVSISEVSTSESFSKLMSELDDYLVTRCRELSINQII